MKVLNEYSKVLTICEKRFFVNVIESVCNFYITIKRADTEEILVNNNKYSKREYFEGSAIFAAFRVDYSVIDYIESLPFEDFQKIVYNNFAAFENVAKAEISTEKAANAAALLAEDAEIFANRAEEEAAAPCYIESAEVIAQYAADAKEAAEKAAKRAALAAEESGRANTEKAAMYAKEAAAAVAKAEAAAKRAAEVLAVFNQAKEEAAEESAAAVSYQEAAAKAEESAKRAAEYQEAAKEAAAVAEEYNKEYINIYSCIQAARSEAEKGEIRSRAAEIKTFAAKYQAKAEAFANQAAEAAAAANEAAYYMAKAAENWEEARRADILAESADKAADKAAEYQEAAADFIKTAAAVAFGFVGFYLTFAIFGI